MYVCMYMDLTHDTRGRPKTTWMDHILQWTRYTLDKTYILKTGSSGDSSFVVWPSLGTRIAEAEGKARHQRDRQIDDHGRI